MNQLNYSLLFLITVFLLQGCALHAPMSEMYMFKDKKVNDSTYQAQYSHAVGNITIEGYDEGQLNKYARTKDPPDENDKYQGGGGIALGTNPIFMFEEFSISTSVGLPPGVDVTTGMGKNFYVTGNAGLSFNRKLQAQLILQKRLLDGNPVGFSIGGIFRKAEVAVDKTFGRDEGSEYPPSMFHGMGPEEFYSSYVTGVRGLLMLSLPTNYGSSRPFLYLTGSYNYDLKIDMWYPKVGVAFGFY